MGNDALQEILKRIEELGRENAALRATSQAALHIPDATVPYRLIFEASVLPRLLIDADTGTILDANDSAATFYGVDRDVLLRTPITDIDTDIGQLVPRSLQFSIPRRRTKHILPCGDVRSVEVTSSAVRLPGRTLVQWDVTETSQETVSRGVQHRIDQSYRHIVETAADLIYRTDIRGYFLLANPAFLRHFGCSADELRSFHYSDLVRSDYQYTVQTFYINQAMRRLPNTYLEFPIRSRDGRETWVGQNVQLLREGRHVLGFQGVARDISERKRLEQPLADHIAYMHRRNQKLTRRLRRLRSANTTLEDLALTDHLTGLFNHRAFQEELEHAFQYAVGQNVPLSLLLIDLDGFKQVNDTRGHQAGDGILQAVGALLNERVRGSDVVARYGGEEFAVILPGTDQAGALAQAERFRRMIESTFDGDHITASFGASSIEYDVTDRRMLVRQADAALYAAKKSGRNCVRHYGLLDPQLRSGMFAVVSLQPAAEGRAEYPENS